MTSGTDGAPVLDFRQNNDDDWVGVYNDNIGEKARIAWRINQGPNYKSLHRNSTCFDLAWVHLVVTARGSTWYIYKDGVLAETYTNGCVPDTLTRAHHCIGSYKGIGYFLEGTVAFLRSWGVELTRDEVQKLYASRNSRN